MNRWTGGVLVTVVVLLAGCNVFGDFDNPNDPWGTKYGQFPTVTLANRTIDLIRSSSGTVTFPVSTASVAEGTPGSVDWFADAPATVPGSAPAGVTVTVGPVSGQTSTVTLTETAPATLGQYRFRVRFGSAVSFPGTLGVRLLPVVPVSGGTFFNGSANMTVSSFRIGPYDVTRAQFEVIMGFDPVTSNSMGDTDPVQNVSWYQAIAFCNKLSLAEGLTPVYSVFGVDFSGLISFPPNTGNDAGWDAVTADWTANGYRLPTEAEWMWAAMGGRSDARSGDFDGIGVNKLGYTKGYSGSIEAGATQTSIDNFAWTATGGTTTHPVGGKSQNELGLFDMSGNVTQWCWDWSDPLPGADKIDYHGAVSSALEKRVDHGGAPDTGISFFAVNARDLDFPYLSFVDVGFRVVRR